MPRQSFLFSSFFVLALVALINLTGIAFSLYWRLWWYDIPPHLLGGVAAALTAMWFETLLRGRIRFSLCIILVLMIGIAWELFEFSFALTSFPRDTADTIKDLAVDTLGALMTLLLLLPAQQSAREQQPVL